MFKDFIIEKINRELRFLEHLRYRDIVPVKEFLATVEPAGFTYPGFVVPGKNSKKMAVGEFWSGRDRYLWLHTDFQAPAEWKGKDVLGVFDFGQSGPGNTQGFESMLFINGAPYQGIDSNHQEVFFNVKGEKASFDFRLWSGLEGGGPKRNNDLKINRAFFCTLEKPVDELYYLLKNMILTITILDDNNPVKSQLKNIMVEGYRFLDFTNPGSPDFITSARKALEYYQRALKTVKELKDVSVSFIGHTHIDLAWLWSYRHTREKAERSFSIVLRLMERYPEYIFLQTQAQLYESVKEDHPELYKAIAQKVAEGRWEASGSMWVEADCNIPSGESLVRQILYGKGFFKKEFGVDNTYLWLPDVFGYNWAMPQILKKSGIDTFITTKISWSEINRMPHDTFIWTGMDGSKVLTHFITIPGGAWFYTYIGLIQPDQVSGIWNNYRDKAFNRDLLFCYGYGDGGGGVNRDMLENFRVLSKLPGLPAMKTERTDSYLKRLHKTISGQGASRHLHNWNRELYLEYHRGTFTSQAYTKKMNRKLELLYRNAEILQSLLALKTKKWDSNSRADLCEGWKFILKAQFHDIIPGSSITEVYEDTAKEHHEAWNLGQKALDNAVKGLTEKEKNGYSVINTAGWMREGLVQFPVPEKGKALTGPGGALPVQVSREDGDKGGAFAAAWVSGIAPLSSAVFAITNINVHDPAQDTKSKFTHYKNGVESPFYTIKWDASGQLVSVYDRQAQREILSGTGNELQIFEDRPKVSDAWEIESTIDLKREVINNLISLKVEEDGPLFTRIRIVRTYNKSTITQDLMLYSMHKRIDFKTTIDWQERSKLLKVAFPVDICSVTARYDIQYGNLERNTTRSTPWDEAQFEVVGHQWADYSEAAGFGVALMNDSKYGYDIKEGVMRLSLLKSAEHPDPEADRGMQQCTYSLYSHAEPWYKSDLIPLAWDLNDPLIAVPGKCSIEAPVKISCGCTALDAIKQSEDGNDLIIRLHEMHGGRGNLTIEFTVPVSGWAEANLMEEPISKFKTGQVIKRKLRPYEIVTFRVKR